MSLLHSPTRLSCAAAVPSWLHRPCGVPDAQGGVPQGRRRGAGACGGSLKRGTLPAESAAAKARRCLAEALRRCVREQQPASACSHRARQPDKVRPWPPFSPLFVRGGLWGHHRFELTYLFAPRHKTCVPQLQLGVLLLSHRAVHAAASNLVSRSANCNASQVRHRRPRLWLVVTVHEAL